MSGPLVGCQFQDEDKINCGRTAKAYRSCGLGCTLIIAYCTEHGGDEQARREMITHHTKKHGFVVETLAEEWRR